MRVLVTRPEPDASKTAARLRDLGHEPIVLPLTEITALAPASPPDATEFDAVVLTSANAVTFAPDRLAARFGDLPCFTVGERSGQAAFEAGFRTVVPADGDAHALVKLLAGKLPAGARLLYLCGRLRRPVLEDEMSRRGYAVTALETYRTDRVDHAAPDAEAAAGKLPVDAALVYSRFGAERLSALVSMTALAPLVHNMRVVCMSGQTAGGLSDGLRMRAEIAASPAEDALIALLGRAH
ncbi:MAG: uroporphyrinogen-III synthase [Rhizobiaceae bacterium]